MERRACEVVEGTELVDEVFLVGVAHEGGFIDEEDEVRGVGGDLCHVVDAEALAGEHGGMELLHGFFDESIELTCCDAIAKL